MRAGARPPLERRLLGVIRYTPIPSPTLKALVLFVGTAILSVSCSPDVPRDGLGASDPAESDGSRDRDGSGLQANGTSSTVSDNEAHTLSDGGSDYEADTLNDGDSVSTDGSDDAVLAAGLVRFNDCDALLDHLHSEYSARVGPTGFGGRFRPVPRHRTLEGDVAVRARYDGVSMSDINSQKIPEGPAWTKPTS